MSDINEDIKKAIKEAPNIVKERNRIISKRANAEYDGVMGTPDDWVPEDIRRKFESVRNKSLDDLLHKLEPTSILEDSHEKFAHQQLLTWIREKIDPPSFEDGSFLRNPFYDAGDDSKDELIASRIDFLAQLWDGVLTGRSKGVPEGLKIIFGEETGRHVQHGEEQEFNLRTKGTRAAAEQKKRETEEDHKEYRRLARQLWIDNKEFTNGRLRMLNVNYVADEISKTVNKKNNNENCSRRMVKKALVRYKSIVKAEIEAKENAERDHAWNYVRKET